MQTAHVNINKEERGNRMYIIQFIRGFCMALADSVPGVSGGTVAFLLGFYDQFIDSIDDLITGNMEKKKTAFFFLIKLGIGWVTGMILAILILANVFESHIYAISSLFIGFIIFAIPIVVREELDTLKGKYAYCPFVLVGAAIVCAITYFNPVGGGNSVNLEHLTVTTGIYVFIAGAVAICAMVLPGISGSTLLLIFGLYVPVINAIHEFMHLNLSYLPVLVIFGLGVLTGIVRIIKICLAKHRSQTIYMILGLMIGSLYAITQGPTTLDVPQQPMSFSTFHIGFFILGAVILAGLEFLKTRLEKQDGGRK